jgi:hypothetical protein
MQALCHREGLAPLFTTDLGLFVHRDDPACTALTGAFPHHAAYKAHFLTYLAALRYFCDTGLKYALILEDDIVRCGKWGVRHAVQSAPEFDMLFLEYCAADCANVAWEKVRGGVVYVGGFKAHCTGACVFSAEGARHFLDFAARNTPTIIDSLTRLYASTERGLSHAVYVRPRIFKQDRRLFPDGVTGDAYRACADEALEAHEAHAVDAVLEANGSNKANGAYHREVVPNGALVLLAFCVLCVALLLVKA